LPGSQLPFDSGNRLGLQTAFKEEFRWQPYYSAAAAVRRCAPEIDPTNDVK
jgi:hypothetical protein